MSIDQGMFTSRQLIFKELFVGTLIYVVALGFFNDYTSFVYIDSFSTLFFAAIVLEGLTYGTLLLKSKLVVQLKGKEAVLHKAALLFAVWLVLFLSKFVFIGVVDVVFGDAVAIKGFFGVTGLVITVTILRKLADKVFAALGE